MKKPLLHLLASLALVFSAIPAMAHATPAADGYVAVQVPHVIQAVSFFRDVLNCAVVSNDNQASLTNGALMNCGSQTIVEVSPLAGHPPIRRNTISLDTNDGSSVVAWLRVHRIAMIGSPVRLANGNVAVSFVTPWGQPLQLVGPMPTDDLMPSATSSSKLASQ